MPKPSQPEITLVLSALMLAGCSTTQPINEVVAHGELVRTDGTVAGTVELHQTGNGLAVRIAASGFEPGARALHLHQYGKCEAPTFMSAGTHLNPHGRTHGQFSETGRHLGDLPNLDIPNDGMIEVMLRIEGSLAEILPHIFDADGTAVMIHAGADDYRTDPTGGAGARIACAILKPAN